MKKIVNIPVLMALGAFGFGIGATVAASNWIAMGWVIVGLLWFLFYWFSKIGYEATIDEMKERHAKQVKDLRKNRDDYMELYSKYWDKYDEKLQQNIDLAQENFDLCQKNLMLAEKNQQMSEYIHSNLLPGYDGTTDVYDK